MAKIGIALGGGGAKGLAHVLMLEALDELGVEPVCVTGTSIGAVIGVLYCSGMSAQEIRKGIHELSVLKGDRLRDLMGKKQLFKWFDFLTPGLERGGLLKTENFIRFLFDSIHARRFEELDIPLRVAASDFWERHEVILDQGELMPAIQASMSMPGAFAPVVIADQVLIDGGAVNPVPFDLLPERCDLTIAIDVIGRRTNAGKKIPSLPEAVFNTYQIMQKSIIRQKLKASSPDIYIELEIDGVRVLEFYKADTVFKQSQAAKDRLKRALETRLTL